jgi:hypothetical protein
MYWIVKRFWSLMAIRWHVFEFIKTIKMSTIPAVILGCLIISDYQKRCCDAPR